MKALILLPIFVAFATIARCQQFVVQAGSNNLFSSIDIGTYSSPSFVDIDNDLDLDLFIGAGNGFIYLYRNTGTPSSPIFSTQDVANNPLRTENFGGSAQPSFVDIDKDGDYDVFVGSISGDLLFYRNNGTKELPNFVLDLEANALGEVITEYRTSSFFVDIDGDLDMDVFVGGDFEKLSLYENVGSPQIASFSLVPEEDNPLMSIAPLSLMFPVFTDVDRDGDQDVFISSTGTTIKYYENTGSRTGPVFSERTGPLNPLNSVNQSYPYTAFADLDLDGDVDAVVGHVNGTLSSFLNNTINLPLKLIAFSATTTAQVAITWQTAEEKNTDRFLLEKSSNGTDFKTFQSVAAVGSGDNSYRVKDQAASSIQYYRLKMIDKDGSFTLSAVIHTRLAVPQARLNIYPNPAAETLHIDLGDDASTTPVRLIIYDAEGRMQMSSLLKHRKTDLSIAQLPTGRYLLTLSGREPKRFIKN